jgi:hypothetical protein
MSRAHKLSVNVPLVAKLPFVHKLYGSATGVIDLGEFTPEEIVIQARMFTNAGYVVGILPTDASEDTIGTALHAAITGSAFGNQPNNDGIELVSDDAADVGRVVTIYGTITSTSIVRKEEITMDLSDGTTQAVSAYTDWGYILGAEVNAAHATAAITIRKADGNATITTIAAEATSIGVTAVDSSLQAMHGLPAQAVASGASTKIVGIIGEDPNGTEIYDAITLAGTTAVNGVWGMVKATKLLTGDVENSVTATVKIGNIGLGACEVVLASGTIYDRGLGRRVQAGHRYLHRVVLNGTTPTAGGAADALCVTPNY